MPNPTKTSLETRPDTTSYRRKYRRTQNMRRAMAESYWTKNTSLHCGGSRFRQAARVPQGECSTLGYPGPAFHQTGISPIILVCLCTDFGYPSQLYKILDFRASKEIQKSNTNMCNLLGTLDSQAKSLTLLSEQRHKDSRTIKALTSVATFYLPASLVATIFSSNLVQLFPTTPSQKPSRFVAAPQMWLPIMVTLSLMAVTLVSIQFLERFYRHFK